MYYVHLHTHTHTHTGANDQMHGQTQANRTKPGPSFQLQKWLCVCTMQLSCFETKLPNLLLKIRPKQLLGYLPLDIPLPVRCEQTLRQFRQLVHSLFRLTLVAQLQRQTSPLERQLMIRNRFQDFGGKMKVTLKNWCFFFNWIDITWQNINKRYLKQRRNYLLVVVNITWQQMYQIMIFLQFIGFL